MCMCKNMHIQKYVCTYRYKYVKNAYVSKCTCLEIMGKYIDVCICTYMYVKILNAWQYVIIFVYQHICILVDVHI